MKLRLREPCLLARIFLTAVTASVFLLVSAPIIAIGHDNAPLVGSEDTITEGVPSRLRVLPGDDADVRADPCAAGIPDVGLSYARILPSGGSGLRVRSGPGREYGTHLILRNSARLVILGGPRRDANETLWYEIAGAGRERIQGWATSDFLAMIPPCIAMHEPDTSDQSIIVARVMSARITAYTYQEPGNGAHGSITYSGLPVRWGLVAVDPRVVPLGSRLSIDGFSDIFLAADTGYGVIGQHIDIFFEELEDAVQFGVQYREVVVHN